MVKKTCAEIQRNPAAVFPFTFPVLTGSSPFLPAPQRPLPLGLDCGALTSARPPLPPRPPAMASRIGLRMQVRNLTHFQHAEGREFHVRTNPAENVLAMSGPLLY